jgi:tRNA threonylcarbamoyladenosine biosynthesis protein TsaB
VTDLLAIETATEACSVALLLGDRLYERHTLAPRRHAAEILPMIEALLAEAQTAVTGLDCLAFGRGPGSFTSIRIGVGVVQGIAFAADLPVVPVSSLMTLAQGAFRETGMLHVLAAFDARMAEVYWCAYEIDGTGLAEPLRAECVSAPAAVAVPSAQSWLGAGSGWKAHGEVLDRCLGGTIVRRLPDLYPRARDLALLGARGHRRGEAVSAEMAQPVYLRDRVVQAPS